MNKHRTHSVDRTPSRVATLSAKALKALLASRAFQSSLADSKAKVDLETFSKNLKKCSEEREVPEVSGVSLQVARDKTLFSTWRLILWIPSMASRRRSVLAGRTCAALVKGRGRSLALQQPLVEVAAVKATRQLGKAPL